MNLPDAVTAGVTRARRLGGRLLGRAADLVTPGTPTRRAETTVGVVAPADGSTPEQAATPRSPASGLPPLELTIACAASDELRSLLEPECGVRALAPSAAPALPDGVDRLLVEVRGEAVTGWTTDQLGALLRAAHSADVPVSIWFTAGPMGEKAALEWLAGEADLFALDEELRAAAATRLGRDVSLLQAAAQPRFANPADAGAQPLREPVAVAVLEAGTPVVDLPAFGDIVIAGLKPMPAEQTRLLAASTEPPALPSGMGGRTRATPDGAALRDRLAGASVVVDLSATDPGAPWTTMAAASSATPLVAPDGLGGRIPSDVASLVPAAPDQKSLRSEVVARINQDELRAREGHLLQRAVLAGHTVRHRVRTLCGGEPAAPTETISAIIPTMRLHELPNVFANIGRQSHTATELVLVLHGINSNDAELTAQATDAGVANLTIVHADRSKTLGACMNLGVDAASGSHIAKMDDDNFYGTHFLSDLLDAFSYTDAQIVGKWCHYVWLRSSGAVVLRYPDAEHSYARRVQGGAMLLTGDVARGVRFSDIPRAVDSDILDRSMAAGARVYSGDRFNFVSVRGTDRQAHTWTVTDATFLTASGDLRFYGDPREHVSI